MTEILTTSQLSVEGSLPPTTWQQALKNAVRSGRELCERLGVAVSHHSELAEKDFPVMVPLEFLDRMEPGNPEDPLLRQVLATTPEIDSGGLLDPVGDHLAQQTSGLLQKYTGRVLLISTGACAIHCRYCFRRHFPYQENTGGKAAFDQWLGYLSENPSIEEVILSGGDPLSIVDSTWLEFVERLNELSQIKRLRLHTRFPVVIPQRVDSSLMHWIAESKAAVYIVLHINHAQEIDDRVRAMFARLKTANVTLLNQAVLLRGVNDTLAAQHALCHELINHQVIPYYLHQLDPVQGGLHFEADERLGIEIIEGLRKELPGYAIPQFVREECGEASKTPI